MSDEGEFPVLLNVEGEQIDPEHFEMLSGVSRERLNLDEQSIEVIDSFEEVFSGTGMDKGRSRTVRVAIKVLDVVAESDPDFIGDLLDEVEDL